jgi:hypothetical protein
MSRKTKNRSNYSPLSLEQLENRALMAGDVAAVLNGNSLRLTGDDLGNEVLVQQVAANQFRVTGLAGTTINGQAVQNFAFNGNELRVDLKGGNDFLEIDDFNNLELTINKLAIDLGAGGDQAKLDDFNVLGTGNIDIKLGNNNQNEVDELFIDDAEFAGNVKIATGGGDDTVTIFDSEFAKNLQIDTAGGSDTVELDNVEGASLTLKLGDGVLDFADLIDVDATGKLTIDGGNGDDAVEMDNITAGEVAIDFRQGQSDLNAEQVDVAGRFNVKGGDLNNAIDLQVIAAQELRLDYAKGTTNAQLGFIGTEKFTLKTGANNDVVNIGVIFATDFVTELGGGND